ncbi:MAG: hypothetical protein K0R33_3766 [Mycobacterium sp.]|nr:hypothetical protein [Mycobacterium sp.]
MLELAAGVPTVELVSSRMRAKPSAISVIAVSQSISSYSPAGVRRIGEVNRARLF